MNVEFKGDRADGLIKERIMVAGEMVGDMKIKPESGPIRCHAGIHVGEGLACFIQGHGATREEAVKNALDGGRRDADQLLRGISALENKLNS